MKKHSLLAIALAATSALSALGCNKEQTCAADESLCAGLCTVISSDSANCGACGNACGTDQGCSNGTCVDCDSSSGVCDSVVAVACYNLNEVRLLNSSLALSNTALTSVDAGTGTGPIHFATLGETLYVANSGSSDITSITFSPPSIASASFAIDSSSAGYSDLEYVTAHDDKLWVSNSATGTLVVIDPDGGSTPVTAEIPLYENVGDYVNPLGLTFAATDAGTKAYVALAGSNEVAVVSDVTSPSTAAVTSRISLSSLVSSGVAYAGPSRLVASGSNVYVTLNNYYDSTYTAVAGAYGQLAVIDTNTNAITTTVDLGSSCLDASGLALYGSNLWVTCGAVDYSTGAVAGGALVAIDVTSLSVTKTISLDHAFDTVIFCNGTGYAGASESGVVIAFDPSTGTVSSSATACPSSGYSYIPDLACVP